MAYVKNTWVDQKVERPKTYEMINNPDGSVTLVDSFGNVEELGTPVNADNMNHIEDGIAEHEDRITLLEEGADTSNYVQKSGDTMTGILNFKQSDTLDFTNTNNTIYTEAGAIYFRDKNDEVCGQISNYFNDYNNLVTSIGARRSVNGVIKTSQIQIYVDKDGNVIATAPNPTQSDSSNKIATTSFCDGKWTAKEVTLADTVTLANTGTITYSLRDYLPNDSNIYEVVISCSGSTNDTGQYNVNTGFGTAMGPLFHDAYAYSITTPVSTSKELRLYPTSLCKGSNKMTIRVTAYRKVR